MKTTSQYMTFTRRPPEGGRKTPTALITSQSSGAALGVVKWHGPWRQFCFYPERETIFNATCMTEIQNVIAELKAERA